jgi:hypothetical protein
MNLIRCDKCKKEIEEYAFLGRLFEISDGVENLSKSYQLCDNCWTKIKIKLKNLLEEI